MVQVGIGDWEIPREVVKGASEREINVITMGDMEKMDVDNTVKMAWDGITWSVCPSTSTVPITALCPEPASQNPAASYPAKLWHWPQKLRRKASVVRNASKSRRPIPIGNAGVDGHTDHF